jgi:autotransporter-associated beta strand protein
LTKHAFHIAPGYGINILGQVGDIGSNAGFDVDGGGTLTLSGANSTLFGPINVKAGVLYARNDLALGNTSSGTTIASGARLAIDGRNLGAEPITLAGDGGNGYGALSCAKTNTLTGPITLAGDCTMNVVSPTDRLILGGSISGVGGLNKMGFGTLELTGNSANTYSGTTTVTDGALELTKSGYVAVPAALVIGDDISPPASQIVRVLSAGQFAATAPVTIHSAGVLDLSGAFFAPQAIGSLNGTGPAKLGVSPLTVGANNSDTLYGGQFTGTGNLIKQGTGKLTLGGISDQFFGATIVNAGTLHVQNWNLSSPVTVNAGGKLMGNGRVGNVTSVGGTFSPGCCPTSMKLGSKNLSLDAASVFRAELNGTNNGAFVYASQAEVTGAVNLNGATLMASLGFNSAVSNKFPIIVNDGIEPVNGTFKGLLEGATFPVGAALMQITYQGGTGNDVVLTQIGVVAAPHIGSIEPLGNGQKKITGTGFPGLTYTVEASTDLKTWMSIGTATAASPGGELSFMDPDAPNFTHRFYRFVSP